MPHNKHTTSNRNQDEVVSDNVRHYLALAKNWTDPFGPPSVDQFSGFLVVRDDQLEVGSKARFGSLLVQESPQRRPLVYVAPRFGFAAISLAYLARKYGRELVLFMPACEHISEHQAVAIEMGAKPKFARIAAMPNLGRIAFDWAEKHRGFFIPLGLKHHLVTAAIVKTAVEMSYEWGYEPCEVWTAMSTGVLSRGLQIAWPRSKFMAVAVARNVHEGEKGRAHIYSSPREFHQDAEVMPPFPSASNYDAKVWEWMLDRGQEGALFWNVAGNIKPKKPISVMSQRDWGDTNY